MGRGVTTGAAIRLALGAAVGAALLSWTVVAGAQGYPPQPYPPNYYPPYPQPPPPPARSGPPPVVYNWDPDVPAPRGYVMDSEPNCAFIAMGIGLFTSGWATAAFIGGIATDIENEEEIDAADGVLARDWMPMFMPVVGPFWAMATLDPDPSGIGLLLTDGIFQVAGVAGILVGALDRNYKVVRQPRGARLDISPAVGTGHAGLQLTGSF